MAGRVTWHNARQTRRDQLGLVHAAAPSGPVERPVEGVRAGAMDIERVQAAEVAAARRSTSGTE